MYRPQMRYGWKIKPKPDYVLFGIIRRALARHRRINGPGAFLPDVTHMQCCLIFDTLMCSKYTVSKCEAL